MRALNEAYERLAGYERPAAPPPTRFEGSPRPAYPYVTPAAINWTVTDDSTPEPATVRLGNRGGAVREIEPDRLGGAFWTIAESVGVMSGEALADIVIAPVAPESLAAGTHVDEVSFLFDGRPITLRIVVTVARTAPPPAATPPPPPAPPPPRPPVRLDPGRSRGAALALTGLLLLAIPVTLAANALRSTDDAGAGPRSGLGLIGQGSEVRWEVLSVDRGPASFSLDIGGSQPAALESSCAYVGGTKVFPSAIAGNRYLQASPGFRSAAGRSALEHRHSYTVTFPYAGAGSYRFVLGCSTDGLPAVDLFTRNQATRTPNAAALRGPLYPDGVLAVARKPGGESVRLGPIDMVGGDLVVHYRRAGSSERFDGRGRSCLRRGGRVVARPAGPNQRTLLMTGPQGRHIRAGRGTLELGFMCGGYEPALPVAAGLFNRG